MLRVAAISRRLKTSRTSITTCSGKTMFSDSEMNTPFRIHALMRVLTERAKWRSIVRNTRTSVRAKSISVGVPGSQNWQSTSTVVIPSVIDAAVGRTRISPRPRFLARVHVKSPCRLLLRQSMAVLCRQSETKGKRSKRKPRMVKQRAIVRHPWVNQLSDIYL